MISSIQSNAITAPNQVKNSEGNASPFGVMDSIKKGGKNYGKFAEKAVQAAFKEVNTREYMAFGRLAGDASSDGIIKFDKAYVAYYDSFSPEDRQARRYAGTRESVVSMVAAAENQKLQDKSGGDESTEVKSSNLMDALFEPSAEVGARVSISDAALQARESLPHPVKYRRIHSKAPPFAIERHQIVWRIL